MRPRVLVLCTLAIAATLGGCGGGDDDTSSKKPVAASLDGTYIATFSGDERSSPGDPTPEAGRWALRLRGENGSLNNVPKRFGYPIGPPLRVSAGTLTAGPTDICPTAGARATYSFSGPPAALRFVKVRDACVERETLLTSHPWRRVSTDSEAKVG
jgi:hypothetical protein